MAKDQQSGEVGASVLVFGQFSGGWAWRVEWRTANGRLNTKDFVQKDLRPGEAKAAAKEFQEALASSQVAA